MLAGLLIAVFLGALVGESDWMVIASIAVVLIVASLAQFTIRNLVAICFVLATLDFWMAPLGFKLSPLEQTGILVAFAWLLVCWRRNFNPLAPNAFLELKSYRFFQNVVLVSGTYAVIHFIYNYLDPYDSLAFGLKGASKTYAQTFGAFMMIVLFARAKLLRPLSPRSSVLLLRIFFILLAVNVALGFVRAVTTGVELETGLSMEEKSDAAKLFLIPGLNAYDSVYTLRQLGPLAVLIGSVFFFVRPQGIGPFLPLVIISLGFLGSLLGAGRATVLFAASFLALGMLYSRRGPLAFAVAGAVAIAAVIIISLPTQVLREAPWHVQRSVAYLRPDLRSQATEGVTGSGDWRWRMFEFAWDHYSSGDARLILFGRSVGQMDNVDTLSFLLGDDYAQMEFSVRRVSTHNGLTDFLLGWGLFGYVLNLAMSVGCIVMLFSYLRRFHRVSHGACWIFVAGSFLSFWLIYTHIGGSFVFPLAIVLVLVALCQTDGLIRNAVADESVPTRKVIPRYPQSLTTFPESAAAKL